MVSLVETGRANDDHWVRESRQPRGEKTQLKLLDAAEELFGEQGVEETSVADIAQHAGVSKGAIYHHFSDKKALVYGLIDRLSREFEAMTQAAIDPEQWKGASIGEILQGYHEVAFDGTLQRVNGLRVAGEIARTDRELHHHFVGLRMAADEGLAALMLARRDEIGHPDPELAVRFVLEQVGTMLRERLMGLSLSSRFGDYPDEIFFRESVRSACGYLQVDVPRDKKQ